ncbi:glycosyltransferase [Sphingomonas sp. BIUV-7]|uniref:Glycosyltransferase n=1 Tax=Sphingomonas natans TaxID=3063330 RepID=A0ABT8YCW3_9SPHN|nr:glycosyltransferase [Sphingomonas sp. BIUV-7]MDO6416170.1 glycosyltransferase [Sphingomonas sp. BIUV-7]
MGELPRDPLGMRLRRLLNAVVDEATPRLATFVFRNRAGRLPILPSSLKNLERGEVINPKIAAPTTRAASCPKIIFQTWKSRSEIPDNYRYWHGTFRAKNPEHVVILWDDDDNRRFIAEEFPWFLNTYNSYPSEIYRADVVRYFFLFRYGGIYADLDTECLRSVDETTALGDVVLCRMGADRAFPHSVPNAVMASRPGEIFWLYVVLLARLASADMSRDVKGGPEAMTGPVLLKNALDDFVRLDRASAWAAVGAIRALLTSEQRGILSQGSIRVLKPKSWYPLDWTNPIHKLLRSQLLDRRQLLPADVARALFPGSTVVTYWSHSW